MISTMTDDDVNNTDRAAYRAAHRAHQSATPLERWWAKLAMVPYWLMVAVVLLLAAGCGLALLG